MSRLSSSADSSSSVPVGPKVDLSVVLPSYRSGPIAARSVERLREYLTAAGSEWEVIVVDDGSGDLENPPWEGDPRIRTLRLDRNRGKGRAVREGMLAASGRIRAYTDVDLPYGIEPLAAAREYISRGFHMVIGDRTLPDSRYAMEVPLPRRFASAIFSQFVGKVVTGGFFDTQCGFKVFRGDVAQVIFGHAVIDHFAFDVEVIYVALRHRLDIKRVPVQLQTNETSSMRLGFDSARMLVDVARIKVHQLRGGYASQLLSGIVARDHAAVAGTIGVSDPDPR